MKIAYVVPGIMDKKELNRRENLLKKWAAVETEVKIIDITEGPASIESSYEEYLSIPITAKKIYEIEKMGFDAAILGCAGDPGLDAMREITTKMLVVGPGQSGMQMAVMLGNRFSVLTVTDSRIANAYELAHKAGVAQSLVSVKPLNIPVLELAENKEMTFNKMLAVGKEAIEHDRAEVLVLKCMSMGFLDIDQRLQAELNIPVINPSKTSLKISEALLGAGLNHSKKAYMVPPKLKDKKVNNLDELYLTSESEK